MGWILVRHLTDPRYASILHGLTLGFHELGHLLASFVGPELFTAAAGTLLQLLAPLAAAAYLLLRQHDPFGATFGTFWLGTSLVEAGRYIADARARVLPLVSPFGPVDATSHDWFFILSRLGLLEHDRVLGAMARDLGVLVMVLSLAAGAGILRLMATTRGRETREAGSLEPRGARPAPEEGAGREGSGTATDAAREPGAGPDRPGSSGDPRTQNAPREEGSGGR